MQIKFSALTVLLLATVLSGCGGGAGREGGSSSVPPPPNLPDCDPLRTGTVPSTYSYISQGLSHDEASERTQNLSIRMINADAAYERGWYDGDGVTIGFYEVAIDSSHPELNGKVVDNPYDEIEPGSYGQCSPNPRPSDTARSGGCRGRYSEEKRNRNARRGIRLENRIRIVSERDFQQGDSGSIRERSFQCRGRGTTPAQSIT